MEKENINEHNLLIKYRNLVLESKGINPKLYFIYFNYFKKNFFFLYDTIYCKNTNVGYKYNFIQESQFINDSIGMFGLNKTMAYKLFHQLKCDNELYQLINENIKENWIYATLPDTHETDDGYPF